MSAFGVKRTRLRLHRRCTPRLLFGVKQTCAKPDKLPLNEPICNACLMAFWRNLGLP
jgi:hypothetical protein